MRNILRIFTIYIHQLTFRSNCPATTIRLFTSSPPSYTAVAADNFHVNFNVNKNTDVSFNTLPRANCVLSWGCQRDYLCVSASGGLSRTPRSKDFNKLIYIPRRQPFCKLHSARCGDWEDWSTPGRTTSMNCCHFNVSVLIISDTTSSCSHAKLCVENPRFKRFPAIPFTRNLRWIIRRKNYFIMLVMIITRINYITTLDVGY